MILEPEDVQGLKHYGVAGMHWGTRHAYRKSITRSVNNQDESDSYRNKAIKTSFKATKKRAKASNIELANPNSKRAARLRAKGDKLANKSAKQREISERYQKRAQSYIKEAADTGLRSFSTPRKDAARVTINQFISAQIGRSSLGVYNQGISSSVRILKENHAAAQANRLQKRKV